MKRLPYIYVCLGAWLLPFLPAKATSDEAVFNKLEKHYVLHADGSQEMRVCKELTLLTHTAINSLYGETFIVYNPDCQTLTIHESYTRQSDGTVIQTPENAFVECLPHAAADAPAYNGLKEMVVVHTGLEPGATLYLDYSVTTRAGYLPELDVCSRVEELSPIREYVCGITVPEGKPLHYALANGNASPEVKAEEGNKTVTWTLTDVPACAYLAESHAAGAGNVQVVLAHTYPSAKEALDVLRAQFVAAEEDEVAALSRKLSEGKSPEERETALKDYVKGLGSCPLSLEETGYRLRPAAEVIRTAYGTEAEKTNLLAGLLEAAGLPSEVKVAYEVRAEADCLGLSAVTKLFLDSPEMADLQDFLPACTLSGEEVAQEASLPVHHADTLTVLADNGKELAWGYRVVTLPQAAESHIDIGNSPRTANLLLPRKVDETYACLFVLPSDMQLCTPQGTREKTNAAGTWRMTVNVADGQVEVIRSLKLDKQLITPAEYADFRDLIAEWEDENNRTLLLESK